MREKSARVNPVVLWEALRLKCLLIRIGPREMGLGQREGRMRGGHLTEITDKATIKMNKPPKSLESSTRVGDRPIQHAPQLDPY